MLEELQARTRVLLEIRDDQRGLLKDRAEAAVATAEEPPTTDAHEVRATQFLWTASQPLMQGFGFVPGHA